MPFELYTCLLEVANLTNQHSIGRIPNDSDSVTRTVQRNQEPMAQSRIRTEDSGHLLETLDPRCVPVIGPQKAVEC